MLNKINPCHDVFDNRNVSTHLINQKQFRKHRSEKKQLKLLCERMHNHCSMKVYIRLFFHFKLGMKLKCQVCGKTKSSHLWFLKSATHLWPTHNLRLNNWLQNNGLEENKCNEWRVIKCKTINLMEQSPGIFQYYLYGTVTGRHCMPVWTASLR